MKTEKLYHISMTIIGLSLALIGVNGLVSGTPTISSQLMGIGGAGMVLTTLYYYWAGEDIELSEIGALISVVASIFALAGSLILLL